MDEFGFLERETTVDGKTVKVYSVDNGRTWASALSDVQNFAGRVARELRRCKDSYIKASVTMAGGNWQEAGEWRQRREKFLRWREKQRAAP